MDAPSTRVTWASRPSSAVGGGAAYRKARLGGGFEKIFHVESVSGCVFLLREVGKGVLVGTPGPADASLRSVKVPVGARVCFASSFPQQATVASSRRPHAWYLPRASSVYLPLGGACVPKGASPVQMSDPFKSIPQTEDSEAALRTKVPDSDAIGSNVSPFQQVVRPSECMPHVNSKPAVSCAKAPSAVSPASLP